MTMMMMMMSRSLYIVAVVVLSSWSSSSVEGFAVPTYDLSDICSRQPNFQLELQASQSAVFRLNASAVSSSSSSSSGSGTSSSEKSEKSAKVTAGQQHHPQRVVFSCDFSLKNKRFNANTSLEVEWQNFDNECPDYVKIIRPEESVMVYLEGSGRHFLSLSGVPTVELRISICKSVSPKHVLKIIAMTSAAATPEVRSDVSSIVLAFLAPFAFILLAVVLAVMGSCCCAKKCRSDSSSEAGGTANDGATSSSSAPASPRPSGSRDTLFTVASIVDKPPSYEELFPAGFIFLPDGSNNKTAAANNNIINNNKPTVLLAPTLSNNAPTTSSSGAAGVTSSNDGLASLSASAAARTLSSASQREDASSNDRNGAAVHNE